jgi:hypothetical protein
VTNADVRRCELSPRRLVIITGPFGSGKTEVAISYALASAAVGRRTALADLDVVNPYFRAQDHRAALERGGVRVVAPEEPFTRYEVPALSPELRAVMTEASLYTVADVGGDPVGARILGMFRPYLKRDELELWLVINPWRPAAVEGELTELLGAIQREAGLDADALISSPNLGHETTAQDVRDGQRQVAVYARELELPIRFVAVDERLAPEMSDLGAPLWPMRLRVRFPWEEAAGGDEK